MATPTVTASLDKATYAKGATMTLTVNYSDTDNKTMTVTLTVTDSSGNSSSPATVTAVIDPLTISVSDSLAHTWTKVSDSGFVAVFTATA
jgi:hypothetical protein